MTSSLKLHNSKDLEVHNSKRANTRFAPTRPVMHAALGLLQRCKKPFSKSSNHCGVSAARLRVISM